MMQALLDLIVMVVPCPTHMTAMPMSRTVRRIARLGNIMVVDACGSSRSKASRSSKYNVHYSQQYVLVCHTDASNKIMIVRCVLKDSSAIIII